MCERCESPDEDATVIVDSGGNTEQWCEECVSDNTFTCDHCGDLFSDECHTRTGDGDDVCRECLLDHYTYCDDCDEYYSSDRVRYSDRCDRYVCTDCWDPSEHED